MNSLGHIVVDQGNNRIQLLDPNGAFLFDFGGTGDGPGELTNPVAVAVDSGDRVIVSDAGNSRAILAGMRVGVGHHLGWAVAVTATATFAVVDRRRIELVEPGMATAPIHHEGRSLDDAAAAALVADVRASAQRATSAALDALAADIGPIESMSLRAWPDDFPDDIAVLRRPPYEARADSVMYREVLAECARSRGWKVHLFDAKFIESEAERILGETAEEVLHGPRATLGPPWTRDHRTALAATIIAAHRAAGRHS